MADITKFGENIRQLRTERGFSLRELAEKAEISPSQLSKIENGLVKNMPDESVVDRLAYALNIERDILKLSAGYIDSEVLADILSAANETAASANMEYRSSEKLINSKTTMLGLLTGGLLGGPIGGLIGGIAGAFVGGIKSASADSPKSNKEIEFSEEEIAYIEAEIKAAYDIAMHNVMQRRKRGDSDQYVQQIGRAYRAGNVRLDGRDVDEP